jgi:hypothetical protein
MSHVATVNLEIRDLDALAQAGKRLGMEFHRGQTTYKWWGHSVGDYPIPEGFTAEDLGKCEHALKSPDAAYEIGVVRRRDGKPGWQLIWDFIDGRLVQVVGKDCCKLKQAYGAAVARKHAMANGFVVAEQQQSDGSIRMLLRK